MKTTILAAALLPLLLACGEDVVNYSAPVPISFKLQSKDADPTSGAFQLSKNISQPSGNPFGAFLNDAQRTLGHPPSRIVATYATLELLPSSTLTILDMNTVFAGGTAVAEGFVLTGVNPAGTLYPVCGVVGPAGTLTGMAPAFDSSSLAAADYNDLLASSFVVELVGNATTGFANASPAETAELQVTVGFVAYK